MFEYVCEVCGKTKSVHAVRDIGRFCSTKCYGISKRLDYMPNMDIAEFDDKTYIKPKGKSGCVFSPESIICSVRKCDNCGWNPVVAKARLEAYGERRTK
jgi:hypothetical protein